MKKIVLITGGFDPIHSGHLAYINAARKLGDLLIIGVNSDEWLKRKKGRAFMTFSERSEILKNISGVDHVMEFDDSDGSAVSLIQTVRTNFPHYHIIFANGGDRSADNILEMSVDDDNVSFEFGVGGTDKKNSSSVILSEWKEPKTGRPWGFYRTLYENDSHVKVKELTVDPGICLSMQRHSDRSEFWFVVEGEASVYTVDSKTTDIDHLGYYKKFDTVHIDKGQWHRLCNETADPLKIIEIQYGDKCEEDDIERKS